MMKDVKTLHDVVDLIKHSFERSRDNLKAIQEIQAEFNFMEGPYKRTSLSGGNKSLQLRLMRLEQAINGRH